MTRNDLFKEPTKSLDETLAELKLLTGLDEPWKSVKEIYDYNPKTTTVSQVSSFKNTLKQRQIEATHNIVRYIYLFWKRMFDSGNDAVRAAQQFTIGFSYAENLENFIYTLVRSDDRPAFPWKWETEAQWTIGPREILPEKGLDDSDFLDCHVICWVRDHDDDWDFAIPVKFLDPNYDFKTDKMFMDTIDQMHYDAIYAKLFKNNSLSIKREIIKILPPEMIERILEIKKLDISIES